MTQDLDPNAHVILVDGVGRVRVLRALPTTKVIVWSGRSWVLDAETPLVNGLRVFRLEGYGKPTIRWGA